MTTGDFGSFIKGGFGLGAGLMVFGAVTQAIGGVTNAIGDAVKAAMEDEASVALLTKAIEENDAAWDGNYDAISDVIDAHMDLAFSDDDLRESLRGLVSVTGDVTKAIEVQRTAMDLARLKNISLRTASELLGKVYAGNLGTLSRYGIVLKKGATAAEAMAEIQRRAAGQAETYAETSAGKMARAQIQMGEAMEVLGYALSPVVADFASLAADIIPAVIKAFDDLRRFLDPASAALEDQIALLREEAAEQGKNANAVIMFMEARAAKLKQDQEDLASSRLLQAEYDDYRDSIDDGTLSQEQVNARVAEYIAIREEANAAVDAATDAESQHQGVVEEVLAAYDALTPVERAHYEEMASGTDAIEDVTAAYDPLMSITTASAMRFAELAEAEAAATQRMRDFGEVADDIAETRSMGKINDDLREQRKLLLAAAEAGNVRKFAKAAAAIEELKQEKILRQQGKDALREYLQRTKEEKAAQQGVTDKITGTLEVAESLDKVDPKVTVTTPGLATAITDLQKAVGLTNALRTKVAIGAGLGVALGLPGFAEGGTADLNQWAVVGERGMPELARATSSGLEVIGGSDTAAMGMGSGKLDVYVHDQDGGLARAGMSTAELADGIASILRGDRGGTRYSWGGG